MNTVFLLVLVKGMGSRAWGGEEWVIRVISEYSKRVNSPGTFDELLWSEGSASLLVCSKTAVYIFCDD